MESNHEEYKDVKLISKHELRVSCRITYYQLIKNWHSQIYTLHLQLGKNCRSLIDIRDEA